ncbi:MAG: 50S ribosomal protein L6 [Candidatus Caenarcaniphilales bacterium]|nr:50S ribosomal protein L6 [Candidatus Caenarcaniphilales bacterium]
MSRIGKKSNKLESGVEVNQADELIKVKGPKGEISIKLKEGFSLIVENGFASIKPPEENPHGDVKALYGLFGSLLGNAIEGVTNGFKKKLVLVGVGYKAQIKGKVLVMALGYSHPIEFEIPDDLQVTCPDQTTVEIVGIKKDEVGQFAAEVRMARPPEPYKGKGVMYDGEKIRRKEGKSGKK